MSESTKKLDEFLKKQTTTKPADKDEPNPQNLNSGKHKKHRDDAMMALQVAMGMPQGGPRTPTNKKNATNLEDIEEEVEERPYWKKANEAGTIDHKE